MIKLTPEQIERILDENFGFATVKDAMIFMQDEVLRLNGVTESVLPEWEDKRVQAVYQILCSDDMPPAEEHWEGFAARRIVASLFADRPRATGCPDTMDDTARFAVEEFPAIPGILRKQAG